MANERDPKLNNSDLPPILRKIRARTPARLLVGRAGAAYRTGTQMDLREAHAAARDAVRAELARKKPSTMRSCSVGGYSKSAQKHVRKTSICCARI